MNQTPSIGRMVHYRIHNQPHPVPAVITYTNTHIDPEDTAVGLFIMSPLVGGYVMDEVQQGDGDYMWNWPPYVPATKPQPKPVPTKGDVEIAILGHLDGTIPQISKAADAVMALFEDFLK